MRKLTTERRAAILSALVDGASINATCRMTGASKITVLRLLADAGQYCSDYHDVYVRGLSSQRVQADEIWSFCDGPALLFLQLHPSPPYAQDDA